MDTCIILYLPRAETPHESHSSRTNSWIHVLRLNLPLNTPENLLSSYSKKYSKSRSPIPATQRSITGGHFQLGLAYFTGPTHPADRSE
jgi:hypothetical protein